MSAKIPAFSDIGKSTKGKDLSVHMLAYVSIAKICEAMQADNDRRVCKYKIIDGSSNT